MADELSRLHMDQREVIVIRKLGTHIIEGIDAVFNFSLGGNEKIFYTWNWVWKE